MKIYVVIFTSSAFFFLISSYFLYFLFSFTLVFFLIFLLIFLHSLFSFLHFLLFRNFSSLFLILSFGFSLICFLLLSFIFHRFSLFFLSSWSFSHSCHFCNLFLIFSVFAKPLALVIISSYFSITSSWITYFPFIFFSTFPTWCFPLGFMSRVFLDLTLSLIFISAIFVLFFLY